MSLGMFAFEAATLPFNEVTRSQEWSFGEAQRVGDRPAMQFLGPAAEKITISGTLLPGLGAYSGIETLRDMADVGEAHPLLDGAGRVFGLYRIDTIDERGGFHLGNGVPRRVDFAIDLTRVD